MHTENVNYTFIGLQSSSFQTIEEALRASAATSIAEATVDVMLSPEGRLRSVGEPISYRKFSIEAYLEGSLVDKIVFVCRYQ